MSALGGPAGTQSVPRRIYILKDLSGASMRAEIPSALFTAMLPVPENKVWYKEGGLLYRGWTNREVL